MNTTPLYKQKTDTMKKILEINVTSFYQSNGAELAWNIRDTEHQHSSSLSDHDSAKQKEPSITDTLSKHVQQIGASLPDGNAMSDYEVTLAFDDQLSEQQKQEFTAAFNDTNTRDESY